MGRATVIGGGADGFYTIEIDVGQERLDNRLNALTDQISTLTSQITAGEAEVAAWVVAIEPIQAGVSTRIDAYIAAIAAKAGVDAAFATLKEHLGYLYTAYRWKGDAERRLAALKLQLVAVKKERAALLNVDTTMQMDVWCADLTENATDVVATIEIPGEPQAVLIAPADPAGSRTSIVPNANDGQLLTRPAMTGPQAYFNAAILPGWQKWMPTYRSGIISDIDTNADTATVTLAHATSSALNLGVNQATVLTGIPVEYMTCNALAFEDGDEVVVQFVDQDWELPKVIGFVSNPQACFKLAWLFDTNGQILGNSYAPEIQPAGHSWFAFSVRTYTRSTQTFAYDTVAFASGGYLYPSYGVRFFEGGEDPEGLIQYPGESIDFEHIRASVTIYGMASQLKWTFLDAWSNKNDASTGFFMSLYIGAGDNESRWIVRNGEPNPYPESDNQTTRYFTLPGWNTNEITVKILMKIGLTKQELYLNGQLMVTFNNAYSSGWRKLGYMLATTIENTGLNPAIADAWDYIGVR